MTFQHGGDTEAFRQEYGGDILDFSANCNPLGMPESASAAAVEAVCRHTGYPDPFCRALRAAIARQEGLLPGQVLCGNGAADLIFRLALAVRPRRALLAVPCFSEYEAALQTVGCAVEYVYLREEHGFALTEAFLQALTPEIDMVFLCSPNNPTGRCIEEALFEQIRLRCEENQIVLVLDACFAEFLPVPPRGLPPGQSVVVLKAFTKFYAMAGLRLGYALSRNEELLQKIADCGQPWSVSAPAQAAGIAALSDEAYAEATRTLIAKERDFLQQGLRCLGATVYDSQANYVFFRAAPEWGGALRRQGIFLRDCANYRGLTPGYYRAAVRTRQENERLLAAIQQYGRGHTPWQKP